MPEQPAVTLSPEERTSLEGFVHRGKANARTITRACILLKSAEGWSTSTLAAACSCFSTKIAVGCLIESKLKTSLVNNYMLKYIYFFYHLFGHSCNMSNM